MATLQERVRPVAKLYADPLRLAAFVLGSWWTSNLLVGWLIGHDFATNPVNADRADLWFIPVVVNGWHLVAHGATGVLGLLSATHHRAAAIYCVTAALFYLGWGVTGLAEAGWMTDVVALDTTGNVVHLIEGTIIGSAYLFRRQLARPLSRFTGVPA